MRLKRREFLKQSALGVGGVLAGSQLIRAAELVPAQFSAYENVALGKTGLKLPRLCLGTGMSGWQRESNQTRLGQRGFTELVRGAHERGVRAFDSADLYGSHSFLATALKGVRRDNYFLISKIWWAQDGIPE